MELESRGIKKENDNHRNYNVYNCLFDFYIYNDKYILSYIKMTIIQEIKRQRRTLNIMKNEIRAFIQIKAMIKAIKHTIESYERILNKLEKKEVSQ